MISKDKLKNAICNGDIGFLIKHRWEYSINDRFEDEDNDTLLLYSASYSNSAAYNFFLNNGADITLVNAEKESIIHAIVYSRLSDRLSEFIKAYKISLNEQTIDGVTPLLLSISLGEVESAKILIKNGAKVNIDDLNGITPLHLAAQLGDIDLVKLLIENGGNQYIKTKKGNYPLALAVNAEKDEVVKYLSENWGNIGD